MANEYHDTDTFRGARFTGADFSGTVFRDCDMRTLKIVDSWLVDVNISGLVGNFIVNDVDVTAFVEAELERRHPERAQVRAMRTADDHRAMWDTIVGLWSDAVARARRLPESARHERVDGEWSFDEVMEVRADRLGVVRSIVDGLDDEGLERVCTRSPGPGYPEQARTVRQCVRVVINEECEHYRYAMRDLAVLEART